MVTKHVEAKEVQVMLEAVRIAKEKSGDLGTMISQCSNAGKSPAARECQASFDLTYGLSNLEIYIFRLLDDN